MMSCIRGRRPGQRWNTTFDAQVISGVASEVDCALLCLNPRVRTGFLYKHSGTFNSTRWQDQACTRSQTSRRLLPVSRCSGRIFSLHSGLRLAKTWPTFALLSAFLHGETPPFGDLRSFANSHVWGADFSLAAHSCMRSSPGGLWAASSSSIARSHRCASGPRRRGTAGASAPSACDEGLECRDICYGDPPDTYFTPSAARLRRQAPDSEPLKLARRPADIGCGKGSMTVAMRGWPRKSTLPTSTRARLSGRVRTCRRTPTPITPRLRPF